MKTCLFLSLLFLFQDWPEFRGPSGQGLSDTQGLPITWSESENIRWKVSVPGRGWSSPVIREDNIWITTSIEEKKELSLRAICLNRASGSILKNIEVFKLKASEPINPKNSYASPTPVLEDDRVYVHFGAYGTACLTSSGDIRWRTRLQYDNGQHGPGGSPVLYEDLLIVSCDGRDVQYVTALDKETGAIRWKKNRRGYQAYSTPLVVRLSTGDQIISPGAYRATAYEPRTGKEIWYVRYGDGFSNVPRPVYGNGLAYICTGFQQPSLLAVQVDGHGDVTSSNVVWSLDRGVPLTSSPLLVGEELYMVSDNGIASCLDARSGKEYWRTRIGGNYSASPVYADGRIYFLSEDAETVVISRGRQYQLLSTNRLDGQALASVAVSGHSIFVRTATHLYCLGK